MRNLRTAAIATATAMTVTLGGVAAASAKDAATTTADSVVFAGEQDGDKASSEVSSDGFAGLSSNNGSSKFFDDEQDPFFATDAFGKEIDVAAVPQWARYWIDSTVVAGIGALIGLVIAGFNWAAFNGIIKMPAL
ncbi:hypothetical protein G7Y29_06770 [Corynebacterium qintianiae]|uniref:Or membrane protein n=1 Tax=Corynebacterium qintianiae TaxID=2709392 RepID=A0A7T0KLG6_9CORY|nr:hypothetical protein [Corynebacterium qintianiae]QPK82586.1 hypothetical protein G7Y29_06770 [Corynebacterium qintianiae]